MITHKFFKKFGNLHRSRWEWRLLCAHPRHHAADLRKRTVEGNPDEAAVSTGYVERSNLTMRMHMLRFTRLTNGFSKKVENHTHAVALHIMYYNFVRIHKMLRVTPAMVAGITERLWEIEDIAKLVEEAEANFAIDCESGPVHEVSQFDSRSK